MHPRMELHWVRHRIVLVLALLVVRTSTAQYAEQEPNHDRAHATPIASMTDGQFLTGTVTIGNDDLFRVRTAGAPAAIYRHRLTIAIGPGGTIRPRMSVRGLTQSGGVVMPGTDEIAQSTANPTSLPGSVQWYGFGRSEFVYVMCIAESGGGMQPYVATLSSVPIEPVDLGEFLPGAITISTAGRGHQTNTDVVVFDAALHELAGYLNDDQAVNVVTSVLTRTYAPGEYHLGLCTRNLATSQVSPPDDAYRNGVVLDSGDAALCNSFLLTANLAFSIVDGAGAHLYQAMPTEAWQIQWYRFRVGGAGACCAADGSCESATEASCVAAGGVYRGEGVPCDVAECPAPTGACCLNDGTCEVVSAANCAGVGGVYRGDGAPCESADCPPPPPVEGACCFSGGFCVVYLPADCAAFGGLFRSAGMACAQADCPLPTGACCLNDGSCDVLDLPTCQSRGGGYAGDGSACTNCPDPPGACCFDRCTCILVTDLDCQFFGGRFRGAGTACGEPAGGECFASGACPCDYNGADGLDSQDFFDFLNDFFSGVGDFNCLDGSDSQDLFDFFDCFFAPPAGCS